MSKNHKNKGNDDNVFCGNSGRNKKELLSVCIIFYDYNTIITAINMYLCVCVCIWKEKS